MDTVKDMLSDTPLVSVIVILLWLILIIALRLVGSNED
jgi:hypothetical protein